MVTFSESIRSNYLHSPTMQSDSLKFEMISDGVAHVSLIAGSS